MATKPHQSLTDLFETVLQKTGYSGAPPVNPPSITVHGNGNVVALGGTVNMKQGTNTGIPTPEAAPP